MTKIKTTTMNRKLILYIAMRLDGYIAKKDDNIDFLSIVEVPNEDYGYNDFQQSIDTVIWAVRPLTKYYLLEMEFHIRIKMYT